MLAQPFIYKNTPLTDSENFELLREEGRKHIERLASSYWSDYNSSDPGITILEALCYAITDLGYRTQFEIKDLFTSSENGVPYSTARFHTAAEILSCFPITFDDLRKVLIDIRGVRNAWVYPVENLTLTTVDSCVSEFLPMDNPQGADASKEGEIQHSEGTSHTIGGLYEVCVEYEEWVKDMTIGPDLEFGSDTGEFLAPEDQGIEFEIFQDVILKSVSVYASFPDPKELAPVRVSLLNGAGDIIQSWEYEIKEELKKVQLDLGVTLPYNPNRCETEESANLYRLVADSESTCASLFAHPEKGFPFELEDTVTLTQGSPSPNSYYFFYDWEWDSPSSIDEFGTWKRDRLGEPDDTNFPSEYIHPDHQVMVFNAESDLILDAVHIFASKKGTITLSLEDDQGTQINTCDFFIPDKLCKIRVPLCWEIPACQGYRLTTRTEDKVKLCMSLGAAFPYQTSGVLTLMGSLDGERLTQAYPFFYDWEISWRSKGLEDVDDHQLTKGSIKREIWKKLHHYRNLCEEPVAVSEISTEDIAIDADIHLESDADLHEVHAAILCALENHIKPPIHFYSLQEMMEREIPTEEIFNGPLLEHGFMDHEEFMAATNRTELRTSDLINLLMDIDGVKSVKRVKLQAYREGVLTDQQNWVMCLVKDKCWKPNFNIPLSCLQFFHNNILQRGDDREVAIRLEEKRLATRPAKLNHPERDVPVPVGEDREPGAYWPMQHDLPQVYRVGKFGVPKSEPAQRKAQAKQLRAYLMFFEQILANYLAQLDHLPQLFSWDPQSPLRTYFTQLATEDIHQPDQLFVDWDNLPSSLADIIESGEEAAVRRNQILDHLLGRFSESFSEYSAVMFQLFNQQESTLRQLAGSKESFLQQLPGLGANRSGAVNLSPGSQELSGFQQRVMALLGMKPVDHLAPPKMEGFTLQQHEDGRWRIAISSNNDFLFFSRFESSRALAMGLIDLIVMQGTEENNYLVKDDPDDDCRDLDITLQGPCDQEVLGEIPSGTITDRDSLMNLLQTIHVQIDFQTSVRHEYLDLASDQFELRESEDGWQAVVTTGEQDFFVTRPCKRKSEAEQVLDTAIRLGARENSYRFDPETCKWNLELDCGEDRVEILGSTTLAYALRPTILAFQMARASEGFHVLEHILLRPRTASDQLLKTVPGYPASSIPPVPEPYSFQATVLIPSWLERSDSLSFRKLVEQTLRREAPAHVYLHIIWVSQVQMREFEQAQQRWMALRSRLQPGTEMLVAHAPKNSQQRRYSQALEDLLKQLSCLQSVFPPAKLFGPESRQGPDTPLLGQMSLSSM